jgi:hypothetical protein
MWRHAACIPGPGRALKDWADVDDTFFGPRGQDDRAAAICSTCPSPVRERCLELAFLAEAVSGNRIYGYRGGMTARERRELLGLIADADAAR